MCSVLSIISRAITYFVSDIFNYLLRYIIMFFIAFSQNTANEMVS